MQARKRNAFVISVVIPAHNEQGNVTKLTNTVKETLKDQGGFEILWVDDGSSDETLAVIKQEASRDSRVRYLSLSRNFGHQAALKAGVDAAVGDCVVTMDGDGEHPPSLIPRMLKLWHDGFDIVFTKRLDSDQLSWHKVFFRRLFYRIMQYCSSVTIESGTADFRLLDRRVVNVLKDVNERDLFWRGIIAWVGFRQAFFTYDQSFRDSGASKYSFRRMIDLSVSGLTSFSTKPLYLGIICGASFAFLSFIYGGYAVYTRLFTDNTVSGWASLLASVLFIGGVQLLLMGIVGIYVGKILEEVKHRPHYIVRESTSDNKQNRKVNKLPDVG